MHKKNYVLTSAGYSRFFTAAVVLLPILDQYKLGPTTFFDVFVFITAFFSLLSNERKLRVNKNEIPYLIYIITTTLLFSFTYTALSFSSGLLKVGRLILVLLAMYIYGFRNFDFKFGFDLYTIVVYIITVLIFVQYLLYLTTGRVTSFLIPNIPLHYGDGSDSANLIDHMRTSSYFRPCTVFIEPAFQAAYLIFWIPLSLMQKITNPSLKNLSINIIVTAMICLSASVTGIVCCVIVWIGYLLICGKYLTLNLKYFAVIIFVIVLGLFFVNRLLSIGSIQSQIAAKIASLNNLDKGSSLTLRVFRGLYCFRAISVFRKVFGCGNNCFYYYYYQAGISTIYDYRVGNNITYMSGWFTLLCNSGIIGSIAYLYFLLPKIIRKNNVAGIFTFVVFSAMMFGTSMFETPVFFLSLYMIVTNTNVLGDLLSANLKK